VRKLHAGSTAKAIAIAGCNVIPPLATKRCTIIPSLISDDAATQCNPVQPPEAKRSLACTRSRGPHDTALSATPPQQAASSSNLPKSAGLRRHFGDVAYNLVYGVTVRVSWALGVRPVVAPVPVMVMV